MSIEIPAGEPWRTRLGDTWTPETLGALVISGLSLVAGLVVAVAWRYLAPPLQGVISVSNGQTAAYYEDPETKSFIGQDATFAVCAVVAAIALALVAFFWFRRRAPLGSALALGGAGIGAAYLAAWFGVWLGPGRGSIMASLHGVPNNAVFDLPLRIRATGVIWLWPAVAVGLYFLLMLVFGPADEPEPEQAPPGYEFPQWADPVDLTGPGPYQDAQTHRPAPPPAGQPAEHPGPPQQPPAG